MREKRTYRLLFPSPEDAARLRRVVADFLDPYLPAGELHDFTVALNEAVINGIRHGAMQPVWIRLVVTDTQVEAFVHSSGGEDFGPERVSDASLDADRENGRGFLLAAACVDSLEVFSHSGTIVRLVKGRGPGGTQRGPKAPAWIGQRRTEASTD